nr:hypothetical protein [Staphylococcus aureus]
MLQSILTFILPPLTQITHFYIQHLLLTNSILIPPYFPTPIFKKKKLVN